MSANLFFGDIVLINGDLSFVKGPYDQNVYIETLHLFLNLSL